MVPITDLAERFPGKGESSGKDFNHDEQRLKQCEVGNGCGTDQGTKQWWNETNEPLSFQTWNLPPGPVPSQLAHLQAQLAGWRSWQKQSQQHGDKTSSSSADSAGSKWINPWLDWDSLHKLPGAFFDNLEHRRGNFTSKQKGYFGRWPAAYGCHCQLSYLLRQPAITLGVKYPQKDKWRKKWVASIPPLSHPKLVLSPEPVTHTFVAVTYS